MTSRLCVCVDGKQPDNDVMAGRQRVLMVRDSEAQTTPTSSPQLEPRRRLVRQPSFRLKSGSVRSLRSLRPTASDKVGGEFRTIMNLYDDGHRNGGSTDILSVYTETTAQPTPDNDVLKTIQNKG